MPDQEQNDELHAFHREGSGIVFEKPKSQEEIARETREREHHEFARDQVKTNRRLAWFTGLLVAGTFFGTGIGIWQASISQTAANAAKSAAESAALGASGTVVAANAAKSAAETANKALVASDQSSKDTLAEMKAQTANTKDLVTANRDAANANDAHFIANLKESRDAFEHANRAYIGVVFAKWFEVVNGPNGFPVFEESGKQATLGRLPALTVHMTNSGNTPAVDLSSAFRVAVISAPDSWDQIPDGNPTPTGSKSDLAKDTPLVASGALANPLSDLELAYILAEPPRLFLVIYGKVSYSDIFGSPASTTYCYLYSRRLNDMVLCPGHNHIK